MANNLTKKDLESFGATIGKSFEVFKKEMREGLKKEKVKQIVRNASDASEDNNEFVLNCQNVYLGTRDLRKEQEFNRKLKELMKEYKVIKCKAELIKNF